jgi:hypothetical protein
LALLAALVATTQGDLVTARMLVVPEGLEASPFLRGAAIRSLITAALAATTVALAAGRDPAGWRVNALVGLAVADLFLLHRSANPAAPPLLYAHRPEILSALGPKPAGVRVYVYDYSVPGTIERHLGGRAPYAPARMPEGFTLDAAGALAMQMYMAPEAGGRFALSQAFNVDYRGLHSASLDRFTSLLRSVEGTPFHLRLLRLAGVEHAVSLHPMDDLAPEREVQGLFSRPILLHRVPDPLPRTYVVGAARRRPDDKDAARLLLDPGFNPSAEVVVASGAELSAAPGFESRARLLEARPDRVVLEAETSAPGVVVLLEGFDPGWRVRLDGQPAELLRANLAFRAVAVPAGRHRIEMTYRPWGLLAGLAAAGLSLVFIGALVRSGSSR